MENQTADVAAKVAMTPRRPETGGSEDGFDILGLTCPDLDQDLPRRIQMGGSTCRDHAIGIEPIVATSQSQAGIVVADIG